MSVDKIKILFYCDYLNINELLYFLGNSVEYTFEEVKVLESFKCIDSVCYLLISDKMNDAQLESFMIQNSCKNISYILSQNKSDIINMLLKERNSIISKNSIDVYLNMIDPKIIEHESKHVKIINRKDQPLDKLNNCGAIDSLTMIAHGNGEVLYFGKEKLVSSKLVRNESSNSIISFLNKHQVNSIFINSCFGLSLTNNSIYTDIIKSNINDAILYRGLKDNYFPECLWYLTLKNFGYNLSSISKLINENIENRSTDLPRYIAIGNPLNVKENKKDFVEYIFYESDIKIKDSSSKKSQFGFIKVNIDIDIHKIRFSCSERISWVYDYENRLILFISEINELPSSIEYIYLDRPLEFCNYSKIEELVELKGSISNKEKNALNELKNLYSSIESQYTLAQFFTEDMKKLLKKKYKIIEKEKKIAFDLLKTIILNKQNVLPPLSEIYIANFRLVKYEKKGNCLYCGNPTIRKYLKRYTGNMKRNLDYCAKCGQISDLASISNISLSIEIKEILEDNNMEIKLCMKNMSSEGILAISLLYDGEIKEEPRIIHPNKKGSTQEIYNFNLSDCAPINTIKVYCIIENELNIYSKPYKKNSIKKGSLYE